MIGKLTRYSLLSFISFCFFSLVFNTVADAESSIISPLALHTLTTKTVSAAITPTPTPTPEPTLIPTATPTAVPAIPVVTDLETLFSKYSNEYHVAADELKKIARCESGFNSGAINGVYYGMFQFLDRSWINIRAAMGLDTNPDLRNNAEEAIRTAAFMLSRGQQNAWPNCK